MERFFDAVRVELWFIEVINYFLAIPVCATEILRFDVCFECINGFAAEIL